MKIPLAFHTWRDGASAEWRPQIFPVPEIESAVADDYALLQYERPPTRRYGEYVAILEYVVASDVFERDIVSVRYAFIKEAEATPEIEGLIRPALRAAPLDRVYLRVYPWFFKARGFFSREKLAAIAVVCVFLAVCLAFFSGGESDSHRVSGIEPNGTRRESGANPAATPLDEVCEFINKRGAISRCAEEYVRLLCGGQRLPVFDVWRLDAAACRMARRNKKPAREDIFLAPAPEKTKTKILNLLFP